MIATPTFLSKTFWNKRWFVLSCRNGLFLLHHLLFHNVILSTEIMISIYLVQRIYSTNQNIIIDRSERKIRSRDTTDASVPINF